MYNKTELKYSEGIKKIVKEVQKDDNSINLIIGVGGQGIKTLCEIKEKVNNNVQYLAIDSDNYTRLKLADESEFMSISCMNLFSEFQNVERIKSDPYLEWLDVEHVRNINLGHSGAGGIRSVGRYLFHKRADEFCNYLNKMLEHAGFGMEEGYRTNIYIITGLSGGTGSGCFLDLSYLVRHVLEQSKQKNVCIQGYFLLSRILLDGFAFPKGGREEKVLAQNDSVALKELDYFMNIIDNEYIYEHQYNKDIKVVQKVPPVDNCYILAK